MGALQAVSVGAAWLALAMCVEKQYNELVEGQADVPAPGVDAFYKATIILESYESRVV